jgi:hypothetical protein
MAYRIRVTTPDGGLTVSQLTVIKRELEKEELDLTGIDSRWSDHGMDDEFRASWTRISRAVGSVNLLILLIYDEGRQFDALSLDNGVVKGTSHKEFDFEIDGVGIHINLFKGLQLDYDITDQLEQLQIEHETEKHVDLPEGYYTTVDEDFLRILPNNTLTKVWQNGPTAVYRYSAPGVLVLVKVTQAPNIAGKYHELPKTLSLRSALSYFSWKLYRQVGDETIYYRNNPPKILA